MVSLCPRNCFVSSLLELKLLTPNINIQNNGAKIIPFPRALTFTKSFICSFCRYGVSSLLPPCGLGDQV
ncbi:hypothetical protein LEMLEM_LOCUS11158 [Lemmus lemmus]